MATTFTASAASGYATDVIWFSNGPQTVNFGHFSSPTAATGILEPGMFDIKGIEIENADPTTFKYSANSNGTYAVIFSGLTVGATGFFRITGY